MKRDEENSDQWLAGMIQDTAAGMVRIDHRQWVAAFCCAAFTTAMSLTSGWWRAPFVFLAVAAGCQFLRDMTYTISAATLLIHLEMERRRRVDSKF